MYALLTYFCRPSALGTDPAGSLITASDKKKRTTLIRLRSKIVTFAG